MSISFTVWSASGAFTFFDDIHKISIPDIHKGLQFIDQNARRFYSDRIFTDLEVSPCVENAIASQWKLVAYERSPEVPCKRSAEVPWIDTVRAFCDILLA